MVVRDALFVMRASRNLVRASRMRRNAWQLEQAVRLTPKLMREPRSACDCRLAIAGRAHQNLNDFNWLYKKYNPPDRSRLLLHPNCPQRKP